MPRPHFLEYANFHCKFGNDLNLLDLAEEIVLPAFFDRTQRRERGETAYFIHRPQIVSIAQEENGTPIVGVAGRFIKNTTLVRQQIFDEASDEIIQREVQMRSAPSAFFVLILNDHRLLYLRETSDAPLAKTFGTTMQMFIRAKYEEFIHSRKAEDEALAQEENRRAITQKALREQYPKPDVHLVPLTNTDLSPNFMERFEVLQQLTFRVLTPNDENDLDPFFDEIVARKKLVNATEGDLHFENRDGLDTVAATDQIRQATTSNSGANIQIVYVGKDEAGQVIKGDNEDFKVAVPFDLDTRGVVSPVTIAKRMWDRFMDSIRRGVVKPAQSTADPQVTKERLQNLQRQAPDWNAQGAVRPVPKENQS